jgi:hypothetical protein
MPGPRSLYGFPPTSGAGCERYEPGAPQHGKARVLRKAGVRFRELAEEEARALARFDDADVGARAAQPGRRVGLGHASRPAGRARASADASHHPERE